MDSSSAAAPVVVGSEQVQEETSGEALTQELIVEILLRLPVKSLLRFMSVSKLWYAQIISPNFRSTHTDRSINNNKNVVSVWLSVYDLTRGRGGVSKTDFLTFVFGPEQYTRLLQVCYPLKERALRIDEMVVGCAKGVFCLSLSGLPQRYALWNPATNQVRQIGGAPMDDTLALYEEGLRERHFGCYGSGICFDPSTRSFMVVQIELSLTAQGTSARVYVFSTATNTWTEKNTAPLPYRFKFRILNSTPAICANGWMHWLAPLFDPPHPNSAGDMYLLSYDMINEAFQLIETPSDCSASLSYKLAPYRQSVAMFVYRQPGSHVERSFTEVDVWVLKDRGCASQSWSKLFTCRPSFEIRFAAGFLNKDDVDLLLLESAQNNHLHLYDPENGETKKLDTPIPRSPPFPYTESLAPLDNLQMEGV